MNPKVSIIIPNYNHAAFLVQRLNSVFNQTYQNFEIILLDDCSTDNSREILSRYAKNIKVSYCIFNETNSGNTFKQWAKGIRLAQGDLIWIAETDDYCDSSFLAKLVKPFQEDSEIVLTYCQSNRVNEFGVMTGNWITHTDDLDKTLFLHDFIMDANQFMERFLIYKNVIPNASAVVLRKKAIIIEEHFDIAPDFKYCGDWIFYSKLIVGKKIGFVSESLNNFRYHSASVIAKANQSEKRISIIDIDINMRKMIMVYFKDKKITNIQKIAKNNREMNRYHNYEKAFLLVRTGNKLKGYLLLLTLLDIFYKEYKIRKNLIIKIKRLFSLCCL